MYGIYCTEAWGCEAAWVQQIPYIPSARDITILYPVGVATMDILKRKKRQAYLVQYSPTKMLSVSDLNVDRTSILWPSCGWGVWLILLTWQAHKASIID